MEISLILICDTQIRPDQQVPALGLGGASTILAVDKNLSSYSPQMAKRPHMQSMRSVDLYIPHQTIPHLQFFLMQLSLSLIIFGRFSFHYHHPCIIIERKASPTTIEGKKRSGHLKAVNKTSISWPSIIVLSAHYFNFNSLSKPGYNSPQGLSLSCMVTGE